MNPHLPKKARRQRKEKQPARPVAIVLDTYVVAGQPVRVIVHGLSNRAGREPTVAGMRQLKDHVCARHTLAIRVVFDPETLRLAFCPIGTRGLSEEAVTQLRRLIKEGAQALGIEQA